MKKNVYITMILAAAFMTAASCSKGTDLSAEQMHEMILQGNPLIVDLRPPEKFRDGHIKGAVNIEFHPKTFITEMNKLPKDRGLFLYCGKGLKTEKARDQVAQLGFNKVYILTGGLIYWKKAGYPLVRGN